MNEIRTVSNTNTQKYTQDGLNAILVSLVRPDTIKVLEENINHTKIFLAPIPKVMKIEMNKWNLISLKASTQQSKP